VPATRDVVVRPPAVAGAWYPGSEPALRRAVEDYMAQVEPLTLPGRVIALVSPHAGYTYSGPTAARAFAQVRGGDYRRVVLLGPLHRPIWGSRLGPFMVPTETAYRTPLGTLPLDHEFIARLARSVTLTPVQGDKEHALEIELPFLQVALGSFSLVPIMLGEHIAEPGALTRVHTLANALAALSDERTLFVASTDLSHQSDYQAVVRTDRRLADLVSAFDVEGLTAALRAEQVQACGATGLVAVLEAARKAGARGAQVLAYAASGDVTGDKNPGSYTVGYLAAAVYR
jgi:AmmeMemoRadiSam system protein B